MVKQSRNPPYTPYTVKRRLELGQALGAMRLRQDGYDVLLAVRKNEKGRGLYAAEDILANTIIGSMHGIVVYEIPELIPKDVFYVELCRGSRWLLLGTASKEHGLGILANASSGRKIDKGNNCRLLIDQRTNSVTLMATRAIPKNSEILVAYGSGMTTRLNRDAAAAKKKQLVAVGTRQIPGRIACEHCSSHCQLKDWKRHQHFCGMHKLVREEALRLVALPSDIVYL